MVRLPQEPDPGEDDTGSRTCNCAQGIFMVTFGTRLGIAYDDLVVGHKKRMKHCHLQQHGWT